MNERCHLSKPWQEILSTDTKTYTLCFPQTSPLPRQTTPSTRTTSTIRMAKGTKNTTRRAILRARRAQRVRSAATNSQTQGQHSTDGTAGAPVTCPPPASSTSLHPALARKQKVCCNCPYEIYPIFSNIFPRRCTAKFVRSRTCDA